MSTVADSIEVHETTVSRAIANKFLSTPHGTFPFKYFFTPGYSGKDGDTVSNTSVKEIIGSIIEQEDSSKPLSDRKIVDLLADKDIKLARRTVAKYREEMGIPHKPSSALLDGIRMDSLPPALENQVTPETFDAKVPLLIDASTPLLQVGVIEKEGWKSIETSEKQVMEGLFVASQKAMAKANLSLSSVDAIFFCEGPNSTLGLRIVCAFIRTIQWANHPTPLLMKYNALDLGQTICKSKTSIQAPFRRGFRLVRTGGQGIGERKYLALKMRPSSFPTAFTFLTHVILPKNFRKKRLSYDLKEKKSKVGLICFQYQKFAILRLPIIHCLRNLKNGNLHGRKSDLLHRWIHKTMRSWAEIDLAALERNLGLIRNALPKEMRYVSVVKADAYGHGILPTAARLMQSDVDLFAVANVKEASEIREMASGWPILVLGPLLEEEDSALLDYDLIATLSSISEIPRFSALARRRRSKIKVHLKVDSGHGKIGSLVGKCRRIN